MAISITNDTLLKLLARQGTDAERLNVLLNSGEFAFTTDTERLFIGDGATNGGVLVGNKFKGTNPDITTFSPAEIGDLAYNSDALVLYRLKQNDGSLLSDWEKIGGSGVTSDTNQALGGVQIDNLVRVTSVAWSTLSASNDPNTFYIVSNVNYIIA
jgi:hypothetical protein